MLKFFRRIRWKLLEERKLKNYLLYAFGEIFLIVIGILIALQIGEWRAQASRNTLELESLRALQQDLSDNVSNIKRLISTDSVTVVRNRELLAFLEAPQTVYHDSLIVKFAFIKTFGGFHSKNMAYESLKAKGVELLKNKVLHSKIITLYDATYMRNQEYGKGNQDFLYNNTFSMIERYFKIGPGWDRVQPNDFAALKENTEFLNHLSLKIGIQTFKLERFYKPILLPETLDVLQEVEAEIQKLER